MIFLICYIDRLFRTKVPNSLVPIKDFILSCFRNFDGGNKFVYNKLILENNTIRHISFNTYNVLDLLY